MPGFLEASDAGRPLYDSLGFVQMHEEFFKLSNYDPSACKVAQLAIKVYLPTTVSCALYVGINKPRADTIR